MKILIISASDIVGGANKVAYRLHRSLLDQGLNSKMLVQNKISDDYTVMGGKSDLRKFLINPMRPALDHILMKINKVETLFSSSYLPFSEMITQINKINPDIVHLHWITGGTMRIEDIARIKAPIVWSLHDMWPFTGGCHYDQHCGLYKDKCGNCRVLESKKENDLSSKVFKRKLKTYSKIRKMTIVATSKWIEKCVKKSTLLKHRQIVTLFNPLDTKVFSPIDTNIVRDIFNIPKGKTVILFGAMRSILDSRKGFQELFKAIDMLEIEDAVFVVAGSSEPQEPPKLKYPTYFISPLRDETSLPLIYNIADVMIVPSVQENLANSIIESLSCGVPVVAFDIGGNGDMIEHKRNGYLAKAIVPEDMATGIEWVLKNNKLKELSKNARNKAVKEFDSRVVSKEYIKLYESVLKYQ